jgi:septal ring factor EnvC (AmiA/AmiB activator)
LPYSPSPSWTFGEGGIKLKLMDWTQVFTIIATLSAIIGGYVFLINKRFEDMNKRFEDVNKRFEDVNRRFDDMNRRIDRIEQDIRDIRTELKEMRTEITEIKVLLYRVLEIPHKEDKE